MKELNFDTGLVTYDLNGKAEVTFNPSDSNFVERLYSAFEDLDKKQGNFRVCQRTGYRDAGNHCRPVWGSCQ